MIFSIVVPLYNKTGYIDCTLQSILAQTFVDFEVLVVDDGSTDDGASIVEQYAVGDRRIRLLQQKNGGVASARNRGVLDAKAEWIAFLDADDYWHPQYLAEQFKAIQAHPAVDMVATQFREVPDSVDQTPSPWPSIARGVELALLDDLPRRWMQGIPFFTSSVAIRKSRLLALQPLFLVGESFGEDLDVWFRVAEQTTIAHTLCPLVAYRTAAAGSLTSLHSHRVMVPYLLRMEVRAKSGGMPEGKRASALNLVAQHRVTLARAALIEGLRSEALCWLWQGRYVAGSKRWLLSCAMLLLPPVLVRRWEEWRNARTSVR